MRSITVLDPGHGGTVELGRSTPFGVRGLNGLVEKNVTLDLARRVAERMATSLCLTRYGDVNLSLSDRAQLSRDMAAPAFVSLHATAGGHGHHGSESWVHSAAGGPSLVLADDIRAELSRIGIPDRGLRRADLAVLNPARHRSGSGACLIEVEHLDDEEGAWRLGNPYELDAVADGVARGIERFLHRPNRNPSRAYAFGRGGAWSQALEDALDLTDFPTNVFTEIGDAEVPTVPRQIRKSDHVKLQKGWDRMMKGKGMTLEGTDVDRQDFRVLLRGGLADSPLVRGLFQEIVSDDTRTLTVHVGRQLAGVFVDAFRFDPTKGSIAAGLNQAGHHTIDLHDFDQLPWVSGSPRNFLYLRQQVLVHALREAREGQLFVGGGDAYPPSHNRAIDDENTYRQEQGQIGTKDHGFPVQIGTDIRWDFKHNGAVAFFETWHRSGPDISSITYSP